MNTESQSNSATKELSPDIRDMLIALGRGLGTVAVYGTEHPSVGQIIDQTFESLQRSLKAKKKISLGSFNGALTVDELPVVIRDIPIRTLEKRLVSMKVSHLSLNAGLSRDELKDLLTALCAPNDEKMKETLSQKKLSHIEMQDVKYVALRDGERTTGKGQGNGGSSSTSSGTSDVAPAQVSQIVAFLKGAASDTDSRESLKKAISDPEKLGQMIMEAASIRQTAVSVQDGESLADVVIGCLRRTYGDLRKEEEFKTVRGKANLTKAMMLLEKTVLDKIHKALGAQHPGVDKRIMDAIRDMEEERQFDVLTSHYFDQSKKLEKTEGQVVEAIRNYGAEKARQQFSESEIPPKDWQRLMVQAGAPASAPSPAGGGEGLPGMDLSALAVVLEKLEGLMQIDHKSPEQIKTAVEVTKSGLNNYANRIETRIQELEGQVEMGAHNTHTIEDHADHLSREDLMLEVSNLTLALVQPLTVMNGSVEAAMKMEDPDTQKEMLELASLSGRRMQSLAKRMMVLVGYPTLDEVKIS